MPLPAKDRWEKKLQKRGPKAKRSGRFTKKGERPRSATKKDLVERADAALKVVADPYLPPDQGYLTTGYASPGFRIVSNGQMLGTASNVTINQETNYEDRIFTYDSTTNATYIPRYQPTQIIVADGTGATATYTTDQYTVIDDNTIEVGNWYQIDHDFGAAGVQAGAALEQLGNVDLTTGGEWQYVGNPFEQHKVDPKVAEESLPELLITLLTSPRSPKLRSLPCSS
jgi:hypothetical protein